MDGQQTNNVVVSHAHTEVFLRRVMNGSAQLSDRVVDILLPNELPDLVVFIGDRGELIVTDANMNVQHKYTPTQPKAQPITSFHFGRRACSFVPSRSQFKQGAVIVTLIRTGEGVSILVAGANSGGIVSLGECALPLEKAVSTLFGHWYVLMSRF